MSLSCEELRQKVRGLALVVECDVVKSGALRFATPFRYSDGSQVDLFLTEKDVLFGHKYVLSDFGQTTAYLLDLQIKPWATKRRKQVIADVCRALEVEQADGQLQIRLRDSDLADLSEAVVRLAQACIRVADLTLTQRLGAPSVFREELEEFLADENLEYEESITLVGRFEKDVPVDFRVYGRHVKSLVLTLSTANTAAAHGLGNEVFRRWYDLEPYRPDHQAVTVWDTRNDVFHDDDLARLRDVSIVFGFPAETDRLRPALAA
jgi:hypothetical protein